MTPFHITAEAAEPYLNWLDLAQYLAEGHRYPRATQGDTFLYRGQDTLLTRSAWIDGMGLAVKTATIFPGNETAPTVNGGLALYSDDTGQLEAMIDFHLVTKWKTVADSLLGALRLANPDSRNITILGAGTVARGLIEAFSIAYPDAGFTLWNRTLARAETLARAFDRVTPCADLETAVRSGDIVLACTMSQTPLICGAWLKPGQHLNLIGAYRPDMREADDQALQISLIFSDSFETSAPHIGELKTPLETGIITDADLKADFYTLDRFPAFATDQITLFKNGGGAHLDLMTARYVLDRMKAR